MHRFSSLSMALRGASLIGSLLAFAAVGCGDTESDGAAAGSGGAGGTTGGAGGGGGLGAVTPVVVDSGLPPEKTIAELTPEELTKVCKAVVEELPAASDLCVIGSLGTLIAPESGGTITEEACTQALESCKGGDATAGGFGQALNGLSGQVCELAGVGGGANDCTATVSDVEGCASGLLTLAKIVPTLDCKTLATPAGQAQLALIAFASGALTCTTLPEKCPGNGAGGVDGPGGAGGTTGDGGTSGSGGTTSNGGTTSVGGSAGSAGGPF